ncbi:TEFM protein, partial [Amia calva]|nr:TEFM protein [Amia calva]
SHSPERSGGAQPSLDSCYTEAQRTAILQVLNHAPESQLAGVKLLRGRKSANIMEYRARHGPFPDLESVVNVPLLKHKTAAVVFHSILHPEEKRQPKAQPLRTAKFVKPELEWKTLQEASSIVSIVCGTSRIAWAHVDRSPCVQDWQQEECQHFMKGTYLASSYLEDVGAVVDRMPEADFYVVEKPGMSLQSATLFPVTVHMRTVEAMLFALLAGRAGDKHTRVRAALWWAVGRHFGLIVGDSRTSGAQLVQQLMTDSVGRSGPRLAFPPTLVVRYRNAFRPHSWNQGEEMCDAVLQALAFYELLSDS